MRPAAAATMTTFFVTDLRLPMDKASSSRVFTAFDWCTPGELRRFMPNKVTAVSAAATPWRTWRGASRRQSGPVDWLSAGAGSRGHGSRTPRVSCVEWFALLTRRWRGVVLARHVLAGTGEGAQIQHEVAGVVIVGEATLAGG